MARSAKAKKAMICPKEECAHEIEQVFIETKSCDIGDVMSTGTVQGQILPELNVKSKDDPFEYDVNICHRCEVCESGVCDQSLEGYYSFNLI